LIVSAKIGQQQRDDGLAAHVSLRKVNRQGVISHQLFSLSVKQSQFDALTIDYRRCCPVDDAL